jgi:hypothetical protein
MGCTTVGPEGSHRAEELPLASGPIAPRQVARHDSESIEPILCRHGRRRGAAAPRRRGFRHRNVTPFAPCGIGGRGSVRRSTFLGLPRDDILGSRARI